MAALTPMQVMDLYQQISILMGRMAQAARAHAWDELRLLEAECRPITLRLMAEEDDLDLPEEMKRAKFFMLRKILEDDAAIRAVTQGWMSELAVLMQRTGTQRKLAHAYGPGAP